MHFLPQLLRRFFRSLALASLLPLGLALAGCGGGSPTGGAVAPANLAPQSLNGRTLTFTDPDQSQFQTAYVFSYANYTSPGGDSGSYSYAQSATFNQGSLHLVSSFAPPTSYTLNFTSTSGGTYVDQVNKTGPFVMQ